MAAEAQEVSFVAPFISTTNGLDFDGYDTRPGTSGRRDCGANADHGRIAVCLAGEDVSSTTDIDRVDDARAFTSDALFSESAARLGRPLTLSELRSIANVRTEYETRDSVTINLGRLFPDNGWLPSIKFYTQDRSAFDPQITNFFEPTERNAVRVQQDGVYAESEFMLPTIFGIPEKSRPTFTLGLGYAWVQREGLVEFLPNQLEILDQYSLRASFGWDQGHGRVSLNANVDYQHITTQNEPLFSHDRAIYGLRMIYAGATPGPLAINQILVGVAHDVERYGAVEVPKDDWFVGANFVPFYTSAISAPLRDLNVQVLPALLTAANNSDSTQNNAQYRTNVTFTVPVPHYLSLSSEHPLWDDAEIVIPIRNDTAVEGPNWYENFKLGVHVDFAGRVPSFAGTKIQLSAGYDFQRFYQINKDFHMFAVRLSCGL